MGRQGGELVIRRERVLTMVLKVMLSMKHYKTDAW